MLEREELLELTRRMTPKRTCFSRIAGAYIDAEGFVDGTFNVHFGKLSSAEKAKNLKIAKAVPYSDTNKELIDCVFHTEEVGSVWQLLMGLKQCELKNDALLEVFYEYVAEHFVNEQGYAIYLYFGCFDVPRKAKDHVQLEDSEVVYDFIIGVICTLDDEYEVGETMCGFLFPAFLERSGDFHRIAVYQKNGNEEERDMLYHMLDCRTYD